MRRFLAVGSPRVSRNQGRRRVIALLVGGMLLLAGCGVVQDVVGQEEASDGTAGGLGDPGDCIRVDMAVSSEKIDLLTDLAAQFNASDDARVEGRCIFVNPQTKASGL